MLEDISKQAADAAAELLEAAHLKEHDLVVIGCSSSEIAEYRIGPLFIRLCRHTALTWPPSAANT